MITKKQQLSREEYDACRKAVSFKDTLVNSFMSGMHGTMTVRNRYDRSPNPNSVTISTQTLMDPSTLAALELKEDWEKENYKKLVSEAIRIITVFNMKRLEVLTMAKSKNMMDDVLNYMEDNAFLLIDAPVWVNSNFYQDCDSIEPLKGEEEVREYLHKGYKQGEVIVDTRPFAKCINFEEFKTKYPMLKREHFEALQLEQVVVKIGQEYKIYESETQGDAELYKALLSLEKCDKWTISQLLKNSLVLPCFVKLQSTTQPKVHVALQLNGLIYHQEFMIDTGASTCMFYVDENTYDSIPSDGPPPSVLNFASNKIVIESIRGTLE
jgi:hypothetical protein